MSVPFNALSLVVLTETFLISNLMSHAVSIF